MVYYGISLNVSSFSGDLFVNNALAAAVEIPAYLVCVPLLYWGRTKALCLTLLTVAAALLAIPFIGQSTSDSFASYPFRLQKIRFAVRTRLAPVGSCDGGQVFGDRELLDRLRGDHRTLPDSHSQLRTGGQQQSVAHRLHARSLHRTPFPASQLTYFKNKQTPVA